MSKSKLNNNIAFENFPNETKINKSSILQYNQNTFKTSRVKYSQIIKGIEVDDYVLNEIKKAKYQGRFDPGSLGNKNIFTDSRNNIDDSNIQKKKLAKNNTTSHLHPFEEGKNLLIAKSEVQYPLKFGKNNRVLNNVSNNINYNRRINKSFDYYQQISTPIRVKRNIKFNNNTKIINKEFRYNSPIDNISEIDKIYNNNLAKKTMINYYNDNSQKIQKTLQKIKYSFNSIDKVSDNPNNSKRSKNNDLSPKAFPNLYIINDQIKNRNNNLNKFYTINTNSLNNEKNNYYKHSYDINKVNIINDINDTENIDDNISPKINNGNEIENDKEETIDVKDEFKKIEIYRKKLLNLFFYHMNNFQIINFKNSFIQFISKLREIIKYKKYRFEEKTIKNIAEIKKKIKSNPYYYGYKKQYINILNEVKTEQNISDTDNIINYKKKYIETDVNKSDEKKKNNKLLIKKRYGIKNKKNIKIETDNLYLFKEVKKDGSIIDKKYIKKKVFQTITYNNKPDKKFNKRVFSISRNNFNDYSKVDKKINRSYDRNELINVVIILLRVII